MLFTLKTLCRFVGQSETLIHLYQFATGQSDRPTGASASMLYSCFTSLCRMGQSDTTGRSAKMIFAKSMAAQT